MEQETQQEEVKSKWDIEREQELIQRKEDEKRLIEIVKLMGYTPDNKTDNWIGARVHAKKGAEELILTANEYRCRGKISVGGLYPRDSAGTHHCNYDEAPKSINITLTKTNEQIIKDIKRRYLPEYQEALKKTIERNNTADQKRNTRLNTIQELGKILNLKPYIPHGDGYPTLSKFEYKKDFGNISIKSFYAGDEVEIEIRMSKAKALKFAEWLKNE